MNYSMKFELKDDEEKKVIWSGTIEMKVPLNHERMAVMAKHDVHRLKSSQGKEAKKNRDIAETIFKNQVPILAGVYGEARVLIQSVQLKSVDGDEVNSLEEFETHPGLVHGFMIVASQYLEGFGPGKNKSPS